MAHIREHSSSPLSHKIEAFITLALFHALALLPFPVLKRLSTAFTTLTWHLGTKGVKVTKRNVERCYPQLSKTEQEAFAKRSFQDFGHLFAEMCKLYTKPSHWAEKQIIETRGQAIMEEAVAKGKGVIVLAPHMGNWELFSHILPRFGQVSALYRPLKKAFVEEFIFNVRKQQGAELIPISRRGLIRLIKAINGGGITWIMPDQCPSDGSGEHVPFLGHSAYTMTLVYSLLRRCESTIVFAFNERTDNGFITHYLAPDPDIYSDDKVTSLTAMNRSIESCISICPEQFQWEYKRFKRSSDKTRCFYDDV